MGMLDWREVPGKGKSADIEHQPAQNIPKSAFGNTSFQFN